MFSEQERQEILARARNAQNNTKQKIVPVVRATHDPLIVAQQLKDRRTNPLVDQSRRTG